MGKDRRHTRSLSHSYHPHTRSRPAWTVQPAEPAFWRRRAAGIVRRARPRRRRRRCCRSRWGRPAVQAVCGQPAQRRVGGRPGSCVCQGLQGEGGGGRRVFAVGAQQKKGAGGIVFFFFFFFPPLSSSFLAPFLLGHRLVPAQARRRRPGPGLLRGGRLQGRPGPGAGPRRRSAAGPAPAGGGCRRPAWWWWFRWRWWWRGRPGRPAPGRRRRRLWRPVQRPGGATPRRAGRLPHGPRWWRPPLAGPVPAQPLWWGFRPGGRGRPVVPRPARPGWRAGTALPGVSRWRRAGGARCGPRQRGLAHHAPLRCQAQIQSVWRCQARRCGCPLA